MNKVIEKFLIAYVVVVTGSIMLDWWVNPHQTHMQMFIKHYEWYLVLGVVCLVLMIRKEDR